MLLQPQLGAGVLSNPGADITKPIPSGPSGSGVPLAPGRVGQVVSGDAGTEFILCRIVLAALTDMLVGQAYMIDKDFVATLLTTAGATPAAQLEVGFGQFFAPATAIGTYYAWLARSGHIGAQVASGSAAKGLLETTATGGQVKAPAAATASSIAILPGSLLAVGPTFTAVTVNGSPTLSGITSLTDISLGATITGTGIPAGTMIGAIRRQGGTFAVDMVANTTPFAPVNATASGTGIVVTAAGVLPVVVTRPTLTKAN